MLSGDDQLSESSPVADVAAVVPAPMTNSKKPDAPITCPKCASVKAFATRGNLNRHIREKHQSVYQDMFSKGQVHPRPKTIQQLMNLYQTNSQVFFAGSNNYLQIFLSTSNNLFCPQMVYLPLLPQVEQVQWIWMIQVLAAKSRIEVHKT